MKFKDFFTGPTSVLNLDLEQRFRELYPEYSWGGYSEAIAEFQTYIERNETIQSELKITVEYVEINLAEFIDKPYYSVSGIKSNDNVKWAIEHTDWREVLEMELIPNETISQLDYFLHCMWELTFSGFSNKEVLEKYEEIINIAKQYKGLK